MASISAVERGEPLRRLVDLRAELGQHLLVLAHLVRQRGEGVRIRLRDDRGRRRVGRGGGGGAGGGGGRRRGGGRRLLGDRGGRGDEEHGDQRTRDERACREHAWCIGATAVRVERAPPAALTVLARTRVHPEGTGVEKAARGGAPTISSGRTERHSSPSRRGFPPRIRSSPPRVVDNVTPVAAPDTIPRRFLDTVTERGGEIALREKVGDDVRTLTFDEYADRATRAAAGLRALGVGPGDRVVMLMGNRPEFHVADVAVLLLGATPISIYNSSSPEQIAYLAGHAEASVAIVENAEFLDRVLEVRGRPPRAAPADRGRAARRARRRRVVGRAALRGARRPRGRGDGRGAARPGDDHLHVGHHRSAEGRDARSPQHLLDGRQPARGTRLRARPLAHRVVPPDGPHRRAHHHALRAASRSRTR